ncbi:uncharacterized protein LOC116774804 [Danaus plexippus]|uniref:uncharacterized protein LOC116774804 n=1 Tax=Danaus plexippus TaxID=13037 RepID=UPI002AAF8531|nr:uncharacterized protein LOC116774804 [Danaus plexippus]
MERRHVLTQILVVLVLMIACHGKNYRTPVIRYPKDTNFWATDFFVKGCRNFIQKCPAMYKVQHICARNYNGVYRNFPNYCQMQYENCNTWRNWRVFKRERC